MRRTITESQREIWGTKQQDRLMAWYEIHDTITPLEAWRELGVYRLAAVVHALRKEGWKIDTEMVEVKNRFGDSCRVASYRLDVKAHPAIATIRVWR